MRTFLVFLRKENFFCDGNVKKYWTSLDVRIFHIYIYIVFDFLKLKLNCLETTNQSHQKGFDNVLFTSIRSHFFFFDLRGVSGPAYTYHDYSPRPTGHPASPGAGKAPQG
jgi:hypothetical protein